MANKHTWSIKKIDCLSNANNQTNVVFRLHWNCQATDGTYISNTFGTQDIEFKEGETFIPYEELTEVDVLIWLKEALGQQKVLDIQNHCDTQIQELQAPVIVSPALPWDK